MPNFSIFVFTTNRTWRTVPNLASRGLHTRGGTETLVKAGHVTSQILGGKLNYTEGGVVEERFCKFHIFGEI
jgi:hypothetical protein